MIVVSNTTPLIGLASIERFDLLRLLFGEVYIPQAVFDETVVASHENATAKREVASAEWIKTVKVTDRNAVQLLLKDLDLGESETIALAREMKADWVLMDEKKGRRKLKQLKMPTIGTVGLLLKGKQAGHLQLLRPELERLRQRGFSISQSVIETVAQQANE